MSPHLCSPSRQKAARAASPDSERQIGRLAIAKHHARRAVENWISEQGGLSQADQAPGWRAYMIARRALSEARNALPPPADKLRGDE